MSENRINIRKASISDAPTAWHIRNAAINNQCAGFYPPESLRTWTQGRLSDEFARMVDNHFYVAAMEGEVVATGMIDLASGKIDAIFVHPDKMNIGLGRRMLSFLENRARESGLAELNLEATINAVSFYRACGFEGNEKSVYHSPRGVALECVLMKKILHAMEP